jgi:hypothetical protein
MKKLMMAGVAWVAMGSGVALAEPGQVCTSDADCGKGEACAAPACPAIACDPDDASCEPPDCSGDATCVVVDDGGGSFVPSECSTDADCGAGYTCEVIGVSSGGAAPCACSSEEPDCGCDATPPPPVETTEYHACVPKPCVTDGDCGDGMECRTYDMGCPDVSMPSCGEGEDCKVPEPVPCEATTYTQCEYKWSGECATDSDCGSGFVCKAAESCTCSGGSDTPASDGGSAGSSSGGSSDPGAPPPADGGATEEDACSCAPSGTFYCELVPTECEQDSDCAPGLVCGSSYSTTPGGAAPTCDPDGNCDAGASEPDGGAAPPAEVSDVPKTCTYPYKALPSVPGGVPGGGDFESQDGGTGAPTSAPGDLDDEAAGPSKSAGDGEAAPSGGGTSDTKAAGCTSVPGAAQSPAWFLLLGALALAFRRSRAAR